MSRDIETIPSAPDCAKTRRGADRSVRIGRWGGLFGAWGGNVFTSVAAGGVFMLLSAGACRAGDDVYQKPSAFIREVFAGKLPTTRAVTLTVEDQARIKRLMGRGYDAQRVRYWTEGARTVWILSDIGKTRPITTGYVVKDGRIERVKVLVYRESHGWEVRERFFTRQFRDARLKDGRKLDKRIDNIAGATLSVRAMTRMAKLALYLEGKRTGK